MDGDQGRTERRTADPAQENKAQERNAQERDAQERMRLRALDRTLARSSFGFRATRVEPNPRQVVWPESPYGTIWVGEDIRRLVPPRRSVYRKLDSPDDLDYVRTLSREIHLVISRRIRSTRVLHGMRQVDLAACIGVSPSTLCRIERGKRPVTFAEIVRIATQLSSPIETFINPPADYPTNEWVRRRRPRERTYEETQAHLEAIMQDELPDLMEMYGVGSREEVEAIWRATERD